MNSDDLLEELPIGKAVEVFPGVIVERRCFLTMLAVGLGSLAIPGVATARMARLGREGLAYEDFLREVVPEARKLVGDTTLAGQDRYLQTLASYAVRIVDVAVPEMRDSGQGAGPGTFIGFNPGGDPFTVLHWRMEPGSRIRYHPHTYGNVVTLGLEGETQIGNFEMVGQRDFAAKGKFKVRKTRNQLLTRGQVNLVNLEHDYIHGSLAGPKGGRGLDITTRIKPKGPFPYMDISKEAADGERGIYEASWTT
jgi:hypothetical protein